MDVYFSYLYGVCICFCGKEIILNTFQYEYITYICKNYFNQLLKINEKMIRHVISLDIDKNDKEIIIERFFTVSIDYLNELKNLAYEIIKKQ